MFNYKIIKSRIIEYNFSQKELAELIGVTEVTLSRWVNGNVGNIEKFLLLLKILNLDPKDLIKKE